MGNFDWDLSHSWNVGMMCCARRTITTRPLLEYAKQQHGATKLGHAYQCGSRRIPSSISDAKLLGLTLSNRNETRIAAKYDIHFRKPMFVRYENPRTYWTARKRRSRGRLRLPQIWHRPHESCQLSSLSTSEHISFALQIIITKKLTTCR